MRRIVGLALACVLASLVVVPAAETAAAGRVRVLSSRMVRDGSTVHVYGELLNETGAAVGPVKISALFYNGTSLVGTESTYAEFDFTARNQRNAFALSYYDAPAGITRYRLSLTVNSPYSWQGYASARVLSKRIGDHYGVAVFGEVKNLLSRELRYVQVVVTFYNSNGKVVFVDDGYPDDYMLAPGERSVYNIRRYDTKSGCILDECHDD